MRVVLDASAYLAYVLNEPGADVVRRAMVEDDAVMSAVNLAEVLFRLERAAPHDPWGGPRDMPGLFAVEPFTEADARASAYLVQAEVVKRLALSLGDRACIGLAQGLSAPVLTADQVWAEAFPPELVKIRLIR